MEGKLVLQTLLVVLGFGCGGMGSSALLVLQYLVANYLHVIQQGQRIIHDCVDILLMLFGNNQEVKVCSMLDWTEANDLVIFKN